MLSDYSIRRFNVRSLKNSRKTFLLTSFMLKKKEIGLTNSKTFVILATLTDNTFDATCPNLGKKSNYLDRYSYEVIAKICTLEYNPNNAVVIWVIYCQTEIMMEM